ncbi:DUF3137 domain-containing protein [Aurantiacibacter xanthus]|uniref:DUF3137 domain-containing protein n=1 Tax=Aurantiacibacter xanthus TaxID=1784712 RepID=A0A3A1PHN1_9SPHN|nr:DUF3137 domain-containing protein [Aurantiacibacter xanthus]RIV93345.1 DUF3137 domain-containing protein [Aurantiacibacter xanthus]
MIARPDVEALMAGELGQWLEAQVSVREEARVKTRRRFLWLGAGLLALIGVLSITQVSDQLRLFLIFAPAMFGAVWAWRPRAEAVKAVKTGINEAIARALGIAYMHDCAPGTGFLRARAHKMVPLYSRSRFEDLWQGDLGGLAFSLCEVHLERKQKSGKNSHYVTVFRGPVITIAGARPFHGVTLLERAGKHQNMLWFGEKDEILLDGVTLTRAAMVHPDFEDAFSVYTSDQVEARWLVHPAYIERLIALEEAFDGKKVRALFKDGELTIVLSSEDMFESGSIDAARDRANIERTVEQFMAMAELATSLNEAPR